MSGHSKWATIKRSKAANDAKRGAIFTKLGNLITIAAKEKGGDLDTNFALRMAVDKAKAANMPKDNIDKAIKRGTGELEGGQIVELYYEGLGPANTQFIIKSLTDNKNRSAANVRHTFTKYGGSLGAVMWNFEKRGVARISVDGLVEYNANLRIVCESTPRPGSGQANCEYANKEKGDNFELELIGAGADDIQKEEDGLTIMMSVGDLLNMKSHLDNLGIKTESAEIEYVPKESIDVNEDDKEKIEKFIEELEDNEDVSDYYTNVNI